MKYFAFDVEATGQNMYDNAIIELGAVIIDEDYEILEKFRVCLKIPEGKGFEKRCKEDFWDKQGDLLKNILSEAIDPKKAMLMFVDFLNKNDKKYEKELVLISNNAQYDAGWINYYLSKYTDRQCLYYECRYDSEKKEDYFAYRSITDTKSVYKGGCICNDRKVG